MSPSSEPGAAHRVQRGVDRCFAPIIACSTRRVYGDSTRALSSGQPRGIHSGQALCHTSAQNLGPQFGDGRQESQHGRRGMGILAGQMRWTIQQARIAEAGQSRVPDGGIIWAFQSYAVPLKAVCQGFGQFHLTFSSYVHMMIAIWLDREEAKLPCTGRLSSTRGSSISSKDKTPGLQKQNQNTPTVSIIRDLIERDGQEWARGKKEKQGAL